MNNAIGNSNAVRRLVIETPSLRSGRLGWVGSACPIGRGLLARTPCVNRDGD
jgi:hypothetical protein